MIYKRCPTCNKRIEEGTKCDKCSKKRLKEYKRYRTDKKEQELYSSSLWIKVRDSIKKEHRGIDVYKYYTDKIIVEGTVVHHIEEVKDNWNRRYDLNNLILLSDSSHKLIHKLYNEGKKKETMELLYDLKNKFEEEFKLLDG